MRLWSDVAKEPGLVENVIEEFLQADYPRVVAAVGLACGSPSVAEDAVQEAVVRLWERLERGERIESPVAWVSKVALNLSRSLWRRLRTERAAWESLAGVRGGAVSDRDDAIDIAKGLRSLPRRQREVAILHYYLEFDVKGIGEVLGVTEGTVKTSLHRARRALALALGDRVGEEVPDIGT